MSSLGTLYRHGLALLTDLYQLTMAHGYWKLGMTDREASFHLHFRSAPFGGGYAIACGLARAVEFIDRLRFDDGDLAYLRTIRGNDGHPIFEPRFLEYLGDLRFTVDVDAVPEGTAVFPHEPLVRVTGPILQGQLLETPLLNLINFPTLVATKAARVAWAAGGDAVLEFGLRRSQGIDGGITASRAAYLGGCSATSNVLAGKLYGIPVAGTHAHSWVLCFESELESFDAYAEAMPNNCVFLVDTYDTLAGVRNAVQVGKRLRTRGHRLVGIRLDSGDLAYLSAEARRLLDEAGLRDAAIVASNDLNEDVIASIKAQGGKIAVWGVGTHLATSYDQPALGGVYKLSAIREARPGPDETGASARPGGASRWDGWRLKVKVSEQAVKASTPGILQVRRYRGADGSFVADMIYDEAVLGPPADGETALVVDPKDPTRTKAIPPGTPHEALLVPIFRGGELVYDAPSIEDARRRVAEQLRGLHPAIKRLLNPHEYPAGLERRLHDRKIELLLEARRAAGGGTR